MKAGQELPSQAIGDSAGHVESSDGEFQVCPGAPVPLPTGAWGPRMVTRGCCCCFTTRSLQVKGGMNRSTLWPLDHSVSRTGRDARAESC